ncbi:hypothetical protein FB45DRAFT_1019021 [Roridomyces roridus]|uniref:Uncharacterized protein n=1 Tax=Roridomyces roridus TaxID=1738132 RepID=A0AAD7FYL6_9AGAR|nr:hypothetical protein FB45DRAFT_1019021 [Roridomyces roridus]
MPSSILNIFSTLLSSLADTQRSLHTAIDSALAVVLCGFVKSNSVSSVIQPPPPPTRTIPWDVPGTKTIPGGGDYQGNSALPVIAFCMTLATCAVVLSLLSRFGVMRHLVKTVDACIYAVLIVLLAPIAILVHLVGPCVCILRHYILVFAHISLHAVVLSIRDAHNHPKAWLVYSKCLVLDGINIGAQKSASVVNIGSIYAVAFLALPIALLLHLADVACVFIQQHQQQGLDPPDPHADPPNPRVALVEIQEHHAHSTHPRIDPTVLDPPNLLADVLPAPRLNEAQEVDRRSTRATASYTTAPDADSVEPSDNPAKSSKSPTDTTKTDPMPMNPKTTAS